MQLGLYQHYNGNHYELIGVCRHSETLEEMIVYRGLYADYALWVRPKEMFFGSVTINGVVTPRFKFIQTMNLEPPLLR